MVSQLHAESMAAPAVEPTPLRFALLVGDCAFELFGLPWKTWVTRQLASMEIEVVAQLSDLAGIDGADERVLVLSGGAVLDGRLVRALRDRPNTALAIDQADSASSRDTVIALSLELGVAEEAARRLSEPHPEPAAFAALGLDALRPDELAHDYVAELRKRQAPLARTLTDSNTKKVERALFSAVYKGVTDIVTRYVWPPIAFPVTRYLARAGVSPNTVTSASLVLSIAVFACFWQGLFVPGLACGFAMAFLDTVDGKLARVTFTSSPWGNVFDHGIDLVAPPLWWFAWWLGLPDATSGLAAFAVWIVLGGHLAGKLAEQAFITSFGIKLHIWQPLDSRFRLISARRNANLLVLAPFALAGLPTAGYFALAAWIIFSLAEHVARYRTARRARARGAVIESWLSA